MTDRHSAQAFREFFATVFALANCDFLICTFSSNVGRLAYELMQSQVTEGRNEKATSLDSAWYVNDNDGNGNRRYATREHKAEMESELELQIGDVVRMTSENVTFGQGENQRTGQSGVFPLKKTKRYFSIVKFPKYDKIN